MSRIVILGGGACGLATGLLLVRDGHEVEVWESDPEPSPSEVDDAWSDWDRRGVKQFRQPHFLQPRVRSTLERDLPDVHAALLATGAARVDPMDRLPAAIADRAAQPGDDRFVSVTARRTTLEHVLAACADKEEGLRVRRERTATGLTARQQDAVPRVTGVRTRSGETPADLVVDAMGRSSPLPDWLAEIGAGPVEEEKEDSGFAYYTRFFRSRDGEVPEPRTISTAHSRRLVLDPDVAERSRDVVGHIVCSNRGSSAQGVSPPRPLGGGRSSVPTSRTLAGRRAHQRHRRDGRSARSETAPERSRATRRNGDRARR